MIMRDIHRVHVGAVYAKSVRQEYIPVAQDILFQRYLEMGHKSAYEIAVESTMR